MRTLLASAAIALALMLPSPASATEAPLPPALMCAQYRAATVCVLMGDDQSVWMWSTPWYSGRVSGPPIPWPTN